MSKAIKDILSNEKKFTEVARVAFDSVDTDKSGQIDGNELEKVMVQIASDMGADPPTKEDVMEVAKGVREALKGVATVNEIRDTLTKKTGIELKSISKELGDKILITSSDMFLDDLNVELEPLPKENEEESTKT